MVLIFLFTIKSLDFKMIITFCPYLRFRSFLRSRIRNGELYLLKYSSYNFITICYIILILLCKRGRGRPKLTWNESVKRDLKDWNISKEITLDRGAWRLAMLLLLYHVNELTLLVI